MPFVPRYSITTNGAITFTGNTLGLSQLINANQAGVRGSIGAFSSLTGSQVPTFPLGTTLSYAENGSQAILNIPSDSSILYAELIWGGNYLTLDQDISGLIDNSITFITPLGSNTLAPDPATANQPTTTTGIITVGFYMRSANVTHLVQAAGGGSYSVGGVPGLVDPIFTSTADSNHAGWTLAVVYANPSLPARNMMLFVGAQIVDIAAGSTDIAISGFVTPIAGPVNGRILLSAQEGDANITGDQALFGPTVGTLGLLSGPNNPATNFFGSQINDDFGNPNTSGTFGTRNQDPFTQTNIVAGRQGWDITNVIASPFLINSQTSAVFRLTTNGDLYMPNTIGIQINVNAPNLQPVKSVDKPFSSVGDTLTYTVVIPNNGPVDAKNVIFTDTVPPDTSYVPDSFTLNGVPHLGADPNTGVNIGTILAGGSVTVKFQVIIVILPTPNSIVNQALMSYQYQSSSDGPVLNGSAISNQVTTQVNVELVSVVKSVNKVVAIPGDILTYSTVITNNGNVPLSNVVFTDTPPVGTAFVPGSVSIEGVPQPLLNPIPPGFSLGDIPVGVSVIVTFQVTVTVVPAPPLEPKLTNISTINYHYQIDPNSPPIDGTTSSNPVVTQVVLGALSVVKSVDKAFATVGDTLIYTTLITNTGTIPVTNVFFTDSPPAGTSFVPTSVTIDGNPQPGLNPSVGFNLGSIISDSSVIVTFKVQIISVPSPSILINQAYVTFNFQVDPSGPPVEGGAVSNPVHTTIKDIKESVCIIVPKVFYSCQERDCFPNFTVELPCKGSPFTFVGITFHNGVIVGSPTFTPIPSRPNFSRAQFTVRISFVLVLKNAMDKLISLCGNLPDIQKDIVIYLPHVRPEFKFDLLIETRSQLLSSAKFTKTCVQLAIGCFIITKVTGIVQLCIPSFGYCPDPLLCEDYMDEELNPCSIFTDITLTPFPNDFFPPQLNTVSCRI